ncbi:hypothetical protein RCS94_10735 [Orbaceae bacterium ac157xtp]
MNGSFYYAVKNGILSAVILNIISFSVWALNATSANTIKGSAPQLIGEPGKTISDINYAVSFELASLSQRFYGNSDLPINGFPKTLKLSDFNPSFFNSQYVDNDGDLIATIPFTPNPGVFVVEWKDKYGQIIPSSDYNKNLNGCFAPYQLKITAKNVEVHSEYGDPRTTVIGDITHTFTIKVDDNDKICGLRPTSADFVKAIGNATWQTNIGDGMPDPNYGGGYDHSQFSPLFGFDPYLSPKKFPTTAFPQAAFTIHLPAPQSEYVITQKAGSGIVLDTMVEPAKVTFITKPTTPIILEFKRPSSGWVEDYEIALDSWGEAFGVASAGGDWADSFCDLFPKERLTNSPLITKPDSAYSSASFYNAATRQVGTFTGEWGDLASYHHSGIDDRFYWTSEISTDNVNYYVVKFNQGAVFLGHKNESDFAIFCEK